MRNYNTHKVDQRFYTTCNNRYFYRYNDVQNYVMVYNITVYNSKRFDTFLNNKNQHDYYLLTSNLWIPIRGDRNS